MTTYVGDFYGVFGDNSTITEQLQAIYAILAGYLPPVVSPAYPLLNVTQSTTPSGFSQTLEGPFVYTSYFAGSYRTASGSPSTAWLSSNSGSVNLFKINVPAAPSVTGGLTLTYSTLEFQSFYNGALTASLNSGGGVWWQKVFTIADPNLPHSEIMIPKAGVNNLLCCLVLASSYPGNSDFNGYADVRFKCTYVWE